MRIVVQVEVDSDVRYLRTARLIASAVASSVGLDAESATDCRIAVDELGAALLDGCEDGSLRLMFHGEDGCLIVEGRCERSGPPPDDERLRLSLRIVEALTDDHQLDFDQDGAAFRFEKSA